jgi:hypothetical protein
MTLSRRDLTTRLLAGIAWSAVAATAAGLPRKLLAATQQGLATGREALVALPGKVALQRLTERPPNFETPLEYFRSVLTPNEAFFVRYHHAVIPQVVAEYFRLAGGRAYPQSVARRPAR